jgi:hypothetical protein
MNVHNMTPSVGVFSGEDSGLLHIIDISVPESPRITATHVFSPSGDGKPRDVAVCGTEIAVVLSSPIKDVYEGHIHFFHTLKRGETQLQVDGKLPGKF